MAHVVTRDEVSTLLEEKQAQLVDVLPPAEYTEEHLQGAISLPLKELSPGTAEEALDRSRPVITYCHDYL